MVVFCYIMHVDLTSQNLSTVFHLPSTPACTEKMVSDPLHLYVHKDGI